MANSGTDNLIRALPSATVLVVRDNPLEVLMIQRHARQHFASAMVFPGGLVDTDDRSPDWLDFVQGHENLDDNARALRIAGIRETFEETGLIVAAAEPGAVPARTDCAGMPFIDIVREAGLRLMLDELVPFGHWITPAAATARFDTHFYLCRAAAGQQAVCDGREAVEIEWTNPQSVLQRAARKERLVLFPTRMNLARLAESPDVATALAAARAKPPYTVMARTERQAGGTMVIIPEEAGYPETQSFFRDPSD